MRKDNDISEMPTASRRVGVLTLSDASGTPANNPMSITGGGKQDDKASCFPKILAGLCIGQMVMLVATASMLGTMVSHNVSRHYSRGTT